MAEYLSSGARRKSMDQDDSSLNLLRESLANNSYGMMPAGSLTATTAKRSQKTKQTTRSGASQGETSDLAKEDSFLVNSLTETAVRKGLLITSDLVNSCPYPLFVHCYAFCALLAYCNVAFTFREK